VRAGVSVLPGAMRATRPPATTVSDVIENALATVEDDREFDVFVSHATEDKDSLVRPLAEALRERGLRVWFDEFEVRLGDSLRRKIDAGLARSRFGVVVLSPAFLRKNWTQYELDGHVSREMNGEQIILPIWHELQGRTAARRAVAGRQGGAPLGHGHGRGDGGGDRRGGASRSDLRGASGFDRSSA
jgi:hypothetical protein